MLTDTEVGQFHTFGYVAVRGCLSADLVRRVEGAHARLIARTPRYAYFDPDSRTRMMAGFVEEDDVFSELIEHPKIMEAMRDIDGTEFLYLGGCDIWSNLDDTPWHSDSVPGQLPEGAANFKTAIYLDESAEDDGSLNVVAGSHHPQLAAAMLRNLGHLEGGIRPRLRIDRHGVPGAVAVTSKPGDVVIFNTSLFHSAWRRNDGKPRRNLFFSYVRDPREDPILLSQLRAQLDGLKSKRESPYIYSKKLIDMAGPGREKMAARLEELGVENVRGE